MKRIVCLIKAIIRCLTPKKKIEYYKHQKTLVDVEEELVSLSDKDEMIVSTKQTKELFKELDKIVFSKE